MSKSEDEALRAKAIGERIAQARREKDGMTQRALSIKLDITERSIADWESGRTIPYKHMRRLEELLGRPASWFLYGENGASPPTATIEDIMRRLEDLESNQKEILALLKKRK